MEYRGNERIMVIDDDPSVGLVHEKMLSKLGYRVTRYSDSLEAVKKFRENPNCCDLVMTDMTMPNMTGAELAREMLSLRPDLPIILVTGYSEAVDKEKAFRIGIRDFLMKPVKKAELSVRIKEVLQSGARSHS
jgi:CheY-like chemotaxis protein